jgi:hypothetical protein
MENVSIKTFLQWRRDIKGNGTVLCWTLARDAPTMEYKRQAKLKKNYMILFVLNDELT